MECKLFDKLAFGRGVRVFVPSVPDGFPPDAWVRDIRSFLRRSVFLDASEFTENWLKMMLDKDATYHNTLLNCTPPWSNCFVYGGWLNFVPFEFIKRGIDGRVSGEVGVHALILGEEDKRVFLGDHIGCTVAKFVVKGELGFDVSTVETIVQLTALFLVNDCRSSIVFHGRVFTLLGDGGRYLETICLPGSDLYNHRNSGEPDMSLHQIANFSFQLMNCRNIVTVEQSPYRPRLPKGMRNKTPKIKFHTLEVSDTLIKRDRHESNPTGQKMPKHVCRGNFAHYTEEAPLFGKYVGMFWRPMHIKGSAKHGISGHDYQLDKDGNDDRSGS